MKKVININFQGRVIPIEETAYELLKQYVDSLRKYFANEEGRDEIINDIESRIAELFSERLKKGVTCITDEDVNAVIASMGRPEDFEANDKETASSASAGKQSSQQQSQQSYTYGASPGRSRLYRNSDDKIIGGVCSGLANYFNIDPVIMRIVFALLLFTGPGFLLYIILWIVIPAQSLKTNITKRLYRDGENKVLGGVAGGLAAYFNIDAWIPRLIFALPLLLGLFSGIFNTWSGDWDFWWGPRVISGSVGSTLFLVYIILWIAVPVATTAAEKLEMRGEKVDLQSIRNTVKEDLESFKSKAQSWGTEVKETAQELGGKAKEFGQSAGSHAKVFATEAAPVARGAANGLGHVIGVLFKAFFLFIAGMVGIALLVVLVSLFGAGVALMPFKGYFLESSWQGFYAWGTLLFFFGVPVLAFLVWIIRKIAGSKNNPLIAYTFGVLWIVGWVCLMLLISGISRNFSGGARVQNDVNMANPIKDRMVVKVASSTVKYYGGWINLGDEVRFTDDSLVLSNVRLRVERSNDSSYHINTVKHSNGRNDGQAEELARKISYNITQWDSVIYLENGFSIKRGEKFRNQHVVVTIQVPVGRRIIVDRSVHRSLNRWFSIGDGEYWRDWDWDRNEGRWLHGDWNEDVEYIMTPGGLERVDRMDEKELKRGRFKLKVTDEGVDIEAEGSSREDGNKEYRYRENKDSVQQSKKDTVVIKVTTDNSFRNSEADGDETNDESIMAKARRRVSEYTIPVSVVTRLFE